MPLQHYIPAAFLANFSASIKSPRRESFISVGDKLTGKCFTTSVSKVAAVQDLYTLFSIHDSLHVDNWMGDYESHLVSALDDLINDNLSALTWASVLVPFIAGFLVRGPDFDSRFTDRFRKKMGEFFVSEYETLRGKPFSDNINLARIRERIDLLAPIMAAKWILLETNSSAPLIINDLGYIGMKGGYIEKGLLTDIGPVFPIGTSHLLAIIPQPRRKVAVEKSGRWFPIIERNKLIKDNHIGFNTLAGTYARRFIFGPNEDVVNQNLIKDEESLSNAIPEPNQLGFIYRGSQAAIGIEWNNVLDTLAKPPKSRGTWVRVDLT